MMKRDVLKYIPKDQKFDATELIELLIVDRSMSELTGLVDEKLKGNLPISFFQNFARGWNCKNAENFVKANNCFKVIVCDPLDDTVSQF